MMSLFASYSLAFAAPHSPTLAATAAPPQHQPAAAAAAAAAFIRVYIHSKRGPRLGLVSLFMSLCEE